jgi:hypothetical protein
MVRVSASIQVLCNALESADRLIRRQVLLRGSPASI